MVKHSIPNTISANETDTNADTSCLGSNFAVLRFTNRSATVAPYHSEYQSIQNVPIVSGATVYDNPDNGESILLIVHEGLYFGQTLDHSLLNPNQIRQFGNTYQDNPYSSEPLGITINDITIPLTTDGTKILFHTRCPTDHEIRTLPSREITNDSEWNPHSVTLGCVNSSTLSHGGIEKLYDDTPTC